MLLLCALSGCGSSETSEVPLESAPPPAAVEEEVLDEPIEETLEPAVVPTAHDVLLLVVHDEPLLPSEERQLGVFVERLERRRRFDVERRDATSEEAALADLFLDPNASDADRSAASLPETFGAASRVVFMRLLPSRTLSNGDHVTQGYGGMLLFRPPAVEPAFVGQLDDGVGWHLPDDRWNTWLMGLLREGEDS